MQIRLLNGLDQMIISVYHVCSEGRHDMLCLSYSLHFMHQNVRKKISFRKRHLTIIFDFQFDQFKDTEDEVE